VRFAFIEAEKAEFPVELLCEVLKVSRSGFYAWRGRPESSRSREDRRLMLEIASIHTTHKGRYGSPRIQEDMLELGYPMSRKRVARLMRQQELKWRRRKRFRTTTNSNHEFPIAPNLLARNFTAPAPDRAWVGDITYIWTDEGWLYLAAILDVFSRRVVGWAVSDRMTTKLATDALEMALWRRQPPPGLVIHTDRGSQYASGEYRKRLAAAGITCSMSRKGNCWDNAVAESFFATLKGELANDADWGTRNEARREIFEFVELYYNAKRRHSTLGYISPLAFEQRYQQEGAAS
jgi:transposase InsO family protein